MVFAHTDFEIQDPMLGHLKPFQSPFTEVEQQPRASVEELFGLTGSGAEPDPVIFESELLAPELTLEDLREDSNFSFDEELELPVCELRELEFEQKAGVETKERQHEQIEGRSRSICSLARPRLPMRKSNPFYFPSRHIKNMISKHRQRKNGPKIENETQSQWNSTEDLLVKCSDAKPFLERRQTIG